MKILYLGSMMSMAKADDVTLRSKIKPSIAPVNFQRNLLKGFSSYEHEIEVRSIPPVPMYPGSKILGWGRKHEEYYGGIEGIFLPVINLPVLKQITMLMSVFGCVAVWCIKNRRIHNKCVLVYGQNVFVAIPQILVCRMFGIQTCNIVTDPIRYVSNYDGLPKWKKALIQIQWMMMDKIKRNYSSFVLLTEPMVEEYITNGKPYIILEGIGDVSIFEPSEKCKKAEPPVIMYAGALTEGFGIKTLIHAIPKMHNQAQFWFFGANGDCSKELAEAEKNNPLVHCWGKVSWKHLLRHMQEASLLISVKPVGEFHTRYQFPSKIMEYMASGTATASTRVEGIPEEYFNFIFPIEQDDAEGIAEALDGILSLDESERLEKGKEAYQFVAEKKNCYVQAGRLLKLLEDLF